ncbi:MAG: MazG-like family protein [Patescibacteria group bacterium]|jgi:NTP pyrophosphatase (non-canonical NTP hydrolase)
MEINKLQKTLRDLAEKKNWGNSPAEINFAEKIALLHAEVSEALEAYRKGNFQGKDGVGEELADILIRTIHLASIYGLDLEREINKKLKINSERSWDNDQLHIDKKNC